MAKNWVKLGGLYLNTSKDGKKKYMVGYLGSAKLFVFKNEEKKEEKDYDYHIMLTDREPKKQDNSTAGNGQAEEGPAF